MRINIVFTVSQPCLARLRFNSGGPDPGQAQGLPDHPCAYQYPTFQFCNGRTGRWFDPPLAIGYDFQQTGSSLFTDILALPVGIDGDGLFEVQVGNQSLGQFAQGTGVSFVQLLGNGVPSFRIVGIDPAKDSTDVEAFPVKLAFNTPTADFTMTPVLWRKVGSSCSEAVCTACPATTLAPIGDALAGNAGFGMSLQNGPANGIAAWFVGIGPTLPTPLPALCGAVYMPFPWIDVGVALLPGAGTCDGAASIPVPLPAGPSVVGTFVTAQSVFICPQGGLGLSHGIEFAVGS
jgi:hypothetical protein